MPYRSVRFLFHGTSAEAADFITQGDFRIDKAGSNAGTLYGRGVYLAESCSKSDEYCTPDEKDRRYILVCRASLGRLLYNDESRPNVDRLVRSCVGGGFHALLGDREKCSGTFKEIIVYDDNRVYPEYIVLYKRGYKKKSVS